MKFYLGRIGGLAMVLLSLFISASAQNGIVPIFRLKIGDWNNGTLLGGVEKGKWIDAKTTAEKLKGDEKISLFDIESIKKGELSLGKLKECAEVCSENFCFEPDTKIAADFGIGTNADWNIMPRLPKKISLNDLAAKGFVANFLKLKGLSKSPVKITQAYRIDLEGDGVEETVVVASHFARDADYNPKLGNYSFVLLRKIIKGKAQTIMITGDFLARNYDSDGSENKLIAIADFNGDGKMDFLIDGVAYNGEENWTDIFELKAGKSVKAQVLSNYCGV